MSVEVTTVDLIRHGEPVGGFLIRGQRDDPLNENGWQQMRAAVEGTSSWQRVVTSPLQRCAQFAHELGAHLGIPVSEDGLIAEIGFGQWEGLEPDRLYAEQPQAYSAFWENPVANTPPGAEAFIHFQQRVVEGMTHIFNSYRGEHVLVVAHGGVIRMMIAQVLGMPAENLFRMEVPYAAISRIRVEQGVPRLNFHCGSP